MNFTVVLFYIFLVQIELRKFCMVNFYIFNKHNKLLQTTFLYKYPVVAKSHLFWLTQQLTPTQTETKLLQCVRHEISVILAGALNSAGRGTGIIQLT